MWAKNELLLLWLCSPCQRSCTCRDVAVLNTLAGLFSPKSLFDCRKLVQRIQAMFFILNVKHITKLKLKSQGQPWPFIVPVVFHLRLTVLELLFPSYLMHALCKCFAQMGGFGRGITKKNLEDLQKLLECYKKDLDEAQDE